MRTQAHARMFFLYGSVLSVGPSECGLPRTPWGGSQAAAAGMVFRVAPLFSIGQVRWEDAQSAVAADTMHCVLRLRLWCVELLQLAPDNRSLSNTDLREELLHCF